MCCNVFNDASVQRVQWYQCQKWFIRDRTQLDTKIKNYLLDNLSLFLFSPNLIKLQLQSYSEDTIIDPKPEILRHCSKCWNFAYPKVYNDLGQSLPYIWRRKPHSQFLTWQLWSGIDKCEVQIIENTFLFSAWKRSSVKSNACTVITSNLAGSLYMAALPYLTCCKD